MSKLEQTESMEQAKPDATVGSGAATRDKDPMPAAPDVPSFPPQKVVVEKLHNENKLRNRKLIATLVVGVLLAGGCFWLGRATTDPVASDAYVALESSAEEGQQDLARIIRDRDAVQAELNRIASLAKANEDSIAKREAAVKTAEAALKTQDEGVKKREAAVSGAEQKAAANTVSDGTWVVGVDIEPGTYKATANVGSRCYWGLYASGTNGDDIIANDIPGGGLPSVTVAAGQDFKTARCGTWTRQ